jgi:cellulose synthase operon protein B
MKFLGKIIIILAVFGLSLVNHAHAETINIALQNLTADASMELHCVADSRDISLPIPERWALKQAVLNLRYVFSSSLKPEISQLRVRLNNTVIAQERLMPQSTAPSLSIQLPVEMIKTGYNTITVQVAQNSSDNHCGVCTPDLWTIVNLQESSVQIDYSLKPVKLSLSELSGFIFDPRLMPHGQANIVLTDRSETNVTLAGVVASGIARRFDYRKVKFSVSSDFKTGVDNVLIGRRDDILKQFEKYALPLDKVEGGYLKLAHLPTTTGEVDTNHSLLIVTGETEEAVRMAALTFANLTFELPGSDEAKIFGFSMPEIVKYSGRESLTPGVTYDLRTLNFKTQTFVGSNAGSGAIRFRLPADFNIRPNQYVKLALNFSYGAGLRPGSSFVLTVNEKKIRAIALDSPAGNFIENYNIEIPSYVFKPGSNVIELLPKLQSTATNCEDIQADSLFLTIFENSTLIFPDMPRMVEMPKIELFMHNGFPFTRWPDGAETTVVLAGKDDRLLAASLNLLGLATQRNGFPLFGVQFSYVPPAKGDLIAVGALNDIPAQLLKSAPLSIDQGKSSIPYPVIHGWDAERSVSHSTQKSSLGNGKVLLMESQSPYEAGRTAMMLVGERPEDILAASEALLDPVTQGKVSGDLVLIEPHLPEAKVSAIDTGNYYMTGKDGTSTILESFMYTQPAVYYSAIVLVILSLSVVIFIVVKRWREKRHATR